MSVQETPEELWGGETTKAVANFPVSGERVPLPVVRWLGRIKGTAARVNADLGLLDQSLADRIAAAGDEIATGQHDAQFPIDVFQTGSGTSSNMNANEVIATLAGDGAHPNDHVNMGQSSNDVFPSAVHLAALDEATNELLPALEHLEASFAAKAEEFKDLVKSGRTHLMDAVPVTLGQEFAGYAAQIRLGAKRVRNALPQVAQIPLGGTATGTGLNTHPEFAARVREKLSADTGLTISPPEDPFEAQGNRDALVELSGALKVVAVSLIKIAGDLALMGSGPRVGIGEIFLPELQKGSSIMPGKVNPVIPEVVLQVGAQVIGNDTAITIGGLQGQFELNVRIPLIARNLLQSIQLLTSASTLLATKCVDGIQPNLAGLEHSAEGTLAVATALNPYIGYDAAAEIVKEASASGGTLREVARKHGVDEETLDKALDLRKIAAGFLRELSRLTRNPAVTGVLGALVIAFSAILVDKANVSPAAAAFFRCGYALPVLGAIAWWEDRRYGRRTWRERRLAIPVGLFFAADLIAWHHAIHDVGAGLATVLGNLQVVVVPFLALAVLGEQVPRRILLALPLVFIGVVLVSGVLDSGAYGANPGRGVAYGVVTGLTYAAFLLLQRQLSGDLRRPGGPLFDMSLVTTLVAGAYLLVAGDGDIVPSWPSAGWLITLALTSQVLGWLLITTSLPRLPAAMTSLTLTIQPIGSVALGAILLRQDPSALQLAGVACILAGLLSVAVRRRARVYAAVE